MNTKPEKVKLFRGGKVLSDHLSPGLAWWWTVCYGSTVPQDAMVSVLVAAVRDGEKKQTSALTNTGFTFFFS